jgi:hypothetical protein
MAAMSVMQLVALLEQRMAAQLVGLKVETTG